MVTQPGSFRSQLWILIKLRFLILWKSPRLWFFHLLLLVPRLLLDILVCATKTKEEYRETDSKIFIIRLQSLIFCLCSGVFLFMLVNDNQSSRRHLFRILGVKPSAYYCGYLFSDYVFYIVPVIVLIVLCTFMQYGLFTWFAVVKTLSLFSFGMVLIPITYLLSFVFPDQDHAFKNSGIILYTVGFLIADAIASIQDSFYVVHDHDLYKLIGMLYPFIFHYWTQGYTEYDTHGRDRDVNYWAQIGYCGLETLIGVGLVCWAMRWERAGFIRLQKAEKEKPRGEDSLVVDPSDLVFEELPPGDC